MKIPTGNFYNDTLLFFVALAIFAIGFLLGMKCESDARDQKAKTSQQP